MWISRNLTNSRPWGKRRGKNSYKDRGREANHKRLKYREQTDGGWVEGSGRKGKMGDGH